MKNRTYFKSVLCAIKGMIIAFKTEKNFRYHGMIGVLFLALNIINKIDKVYWVAYVITVTGVFGAEIINTAIEHTLNMISTEVREDIRIAKDISAGMILCWGIGFFVIEIMALAGS